MSDLVILKILSTRDKYDRYIQYINNVSKEVSTVLKDMGEWYTVSKMDEVEWPSFSAWFKHSKHPTMRPDMVEVYDKLFTTLDEVDYDEDETTPIVRSFLDRSVSDDLEGMSSGLSMIHT